MQICRCNIKVNSTHRSIKSDRVNLVAPASPVHRASPVQISESDEEENNSRETFQLTELTES